VAAEHEATVQHLASSHAVEVAAAAAQSNRLLAQMQARHESELYTLDGEMHAERR
jgi:flagellar biosynthesis/type III secretory pathway chaperone